MWQFTQYNFEDGLSVTKKKVIKWSFHSETIERVSQEPCAAVTKEEWNSSIGENQWKVNELKRKQSVGVSSCRQGKDVTWTLSNQKRGYTKNVGQFLWENENNCENGSTITQKY